jgi:hypothetical protein
MLGRPAAASPDGSAFFTAQPPARDEAGRAIPDGHYLCAQPVGKTGLWVTRLRREMLRPGQGVALVPSGDYWAALRRHADFVVVDAPAADRDPAALKVAPFMDATVLVLAAEGEDTRAPAALRDAIEQAGGRCAGLVFNRAQITPPRFLRRLFG